MLTEELIDELVQRFNGFNRTGDHGLLRYLNAAHMILMSIESEQTLIYDDTTGHLPLLQTYDTVHKYVMASNVWRVSGILVDARRDMWPAQDYGLVRNLRSSRQNSVMIGGRYYAKIPYVRTHDFVNSNQLCRIVFTVNPKDSIDLYYLQSYKRPTDIISESIQVDIPAPLDFDILIPATAKLIDGVLNGNYDDARRMVRQELKPLLWKEMDSGDQGCYDAEPVDRGF